MVFFLKSGSSSYQRRKNYYIKHQRLKFVSLLFEKKRKNFRGDNNNDGDDDGMNGSNEVHETTIHSHFAASSHKLYIKDQTGQVTFHRDVV